MAYELLIEEVDNSIDTKKITEDLERYNNKCQLFSEEDIKYRLVQYRVVYKSAFNEPWHPGVLDTKHGKRLAILIYLTHSSKLIKLDNIPGVTYIFVTDRFNGYYALHKEKKILKMKKGTECWIVPTANAFWSRSTRVNVDGHFNTDNMPITARNLFKKVNAEVVISE